MMIEKIARAMHHHSYPNDEVHFEVLRIKYMHLAKTALETMLEPTEEMTTKQDDCEFHNSCHMCGGHIHGYKIMIKQALEKAK